MAFHSRLYTNAPDLQAMIDLLYTVRPANRLNDYPGEINLREMLATARQQPHTRLWFSSDGSLAAFALVDAYNNLWFEMTATADQLADQIIQ